MDRLSAIFCVGSIESVTGWTGAHSDEPPSIGPATVPDAKHKNGRDARCFDVSEGEAVSHIKSASDLKFASPLSLKFESSKEGWIAGYGSVFGNVDSVGDIVMPGAFTKSLEENRQRGFTVKMLWNHDSHRPIGKWVNLKEDSRGLYVEGQINLKTSDGRDMYEHILAGDVTGLSIGYRVVKETPERNITKLEELRLYEVSPVVFPANAQAGIDAVKTLQSKQELIELLRSNGIARQAAERIAGGGWKALAKDDGHGDRLLAQGIENIKTYTAVFDELNNILKGMSK